jgi:hypothetical protein
LPVTVYVHLFALMQSCTFGVDAEGGGVATTTELAVSRELASPLQKVLETCGE